MAGARGKESEDTWVDQFGARVFEVAPLVFAAASFLAGAATLIAVATPALPHIRGLDTIERALEELPELSASIVGVALMGLATGLSRRIDAAWSATTALLAAICLYASVRHGHVVAALLTGSSALLLLISRPAFFRHSRLVELMPDRRVALAIAAALGAALVAALLWAGARPGFREAPWWALLTDSHLGRPGRALAAGGAAIALVVAHHFLLGRPRGTPTRPVIDDFERAERIIAETADAAPDAQLAFMSDKSFLFVADAFLMCARGGGNLIAMGGPVGPRQSWRPALASLRAEAERLSLRPVIYAAPPDLLPELLDLGFRAEKVGENAMVELADFSLAGPAKQKLRSARRKFVEREGAVFEMMAPPHTDTPWGELQAVSEAWLKEHGGKEKAFSMGAFSARYLKRHHIAVVRQQGRIRAFANVWINAGWRRAALDLMRFDPDHAASGIMDFLFTEILLWAREREIRSFDLGMAPLTGLSADNYASLFARIGRLVRQFGEAYYGFEGLRAFKEKFGPRWEPRYIAAPGAWALPLVLAEVAALTNGAGGESAVSITTSRQT